MTLINDILDLAKIEAGKMELYPTEIDLHHFLKGIVGIMRMRAEQKELLFSFEIDDTLPNGVQVDETRLRQVLINLLANAVKFTDKGEVTLHIHLLSNGKSPIGFNQKSLTHHNDFNHSSLLKASKAAEVVTTSHDLYPFRDKDHHNATLRFEVRDTGVGMSQQEVEKIFLPFEQVGKKENRSQGTGLGLSITRQLITLMGGEIKLKSQLGQGSTFWFDLNLPVVDGKGTPEAIQTPTHAIVGYEGPTQTILIADDVLMNRLLLRELLSPLGFEIIEAENGQQAVQRAIKNQPDLILMDVVMPLMSGPQAVRAIRQQSVGQEVVIIALSANLFAQEESQQAGCDAFLPKPIDTDQLLAEIEGFLGLTWHYAETQPHHKNGQTPLINEVIVPPPPEELASLYRLAQIWDLMEIEKRAKQLSINPELAPFARRLRQLVDGFKGEEILALIEQYQI